MRKIGFKGMLLVAYLFLFLLVNTFIGSRPPLPFLPYGLAFLIVLIVGITAAYLAHRITNMREIFLKLFTASCILLAIYVSVQVFIYIKLGDNIYWIRSLVNLPLFFLIWLIVSDSNKFSKIFGINKN